MEKEFGQESHFERLIALADAVFDVKNDQGQLDVNEEVLSRLGEIHPACVSEFRDEKGPAAWILMIPSTETNMRNFLSGNISEKELFECCRPGDAFEAIYLCSALVLEEYRRKGITKKLSLEAIGKMKADFPVKQLFVWAFSKEGLACARNLAELSGLPEPLCRLYGSAE